MSKKEAEADRKADIVADAQAKWKLCYDWEQSSRQAALEDYKFANGDSYNNYQWPGDVLDARGGPESDRPILTINKARQNNLQIVNDARKNKPAIAFRPVGNGATFQSAQIWNGIARHIESQSMAQSIYDEATKFCVQMGFGFWRVKTDYVSDMSFDQEIYIAPIMNPWSVLTDMNAKEPDKRDMTYGFVSEDVDRELFDMKYPKYSDLPNELALSEGSGTWVTRDHIRVCEFYRQEATKDTLLAIFAQNSAQPLMVYKSELKGDLLDHAMSNPQTRQREIMRKAVRKYLIVGDKVVEENDWAGRYIPIVKITGEETVIDNKYDCKGHTRYLKDPQRMYNYWSPLDLRTPIPTPFGWTTMGEIRVGDQVFGMDGKPCAVIGLSPVHENRECYRIEFDDKSYIIADAEHKWTVETRGKRKAQTYDWKDETITTAQLSVKRHYVCLSEPLKLDYLSDLPVDPYVLGAWLGDGTTSIPVITAGLTDLDEMMALIAACGYALGEPILKKDASAGTFSLYGVVAKFKEFGLIGDKHIPPMYLRASVEQRWALLQGLMDTDGSYDRANNVCSFYNTNAAIIRGILELLHSLGIKPGVLKRPGHYKMFPNGKHYDTKSSWMVTFTADPTEPVFRLSRKRQQQTKARPVHWRRTKRLGILSVTKIDSVPVRCITVDTKDHLFLAGWSMIPTHNSSAVEYGAMQTKTPWIAPAEAIEEHEEDWNESNVQNKSVLTYNALADDGSTVIPPPQRVQPPVAAPVCIEGMRIASDELMAASGQYAATMGAPGNERSAKAIMERERQSDTSTYHFTDAVARGIRYTALIIKDLAPKIYDTQRMLQIMAEDGKTIEIQIDPSAKKAYEEQQQENSEAIQRIFNPAVGDYEVIVDVGPDWGTKREEAFNAFSMLLGQAPQMIPILGDLLLKSGDFPMAEQAAERLYRMLPPQAKGDGPSPQEQALQQRISALSEAMQSLLMEKSKLDLEMKGKDQQKFIDAFNAVTQRLKVIGDQGMSIAEHRLLVMKTLSESLGIDPQTAAAASAPALESDAQPSLPLQFSQPPVPQGAHMGADGGTYMKDYSHSPMYKRV